MVAVRHVLLGASILLAGCVAHRGAGWERSAPLPQPGAASLIVLGDAGAAGRTAARVADELARALAQEPRAIVLWVGDSVLPARECARRLECPAVRTAWSRDGSRELAAVVRRHVERGGKSFGISGDFDWRCKHAGQLIGAEPSGTPPFAMPTGHYVVRVGTDGSAVVTTRCDAKGCARAESRGAALVDLVMVDVVPHVRPGAATPAAREAQARALDRLLDVLAGAAGPPRVLVSQVPVEAANEHGLGGIDPVATWHNLPPRLRAALQDGTFVGAISALDRASYVEPDLGPAIQRSDKAFVAAPIWQVVAGASSRPNARAAAAGRRTRFARGIAYVPDLMSDHPGFAIVRVGPTRTDVVLRVRKGRSWRSGVMSVPTRPPANPREIATVPMQPCLRCAEVPAAERR
jgi:hypothetical protein